jgi:hypothetical protein
MLWDAIRVLLAAAYLSCVIIILAAAIDWARHHRKN